jgi:hypothetical protein
LKNPSQKRAGGVGPEFKPQYQKKKKEKEKKTVSVFQLQNMVTRVLSL